MMYYIENNVLDAVVSLLEEAGVGEAGETIMVGEFTAETPDRAIVLSPDGGDRAVDTTRVERFIIVCRAATGPDAWALAGEVRAALHGRYEIEQGGTLFHYIEELAGWDLASIDDHDRWEVRLRFEAHTEEVKI